MANTKDILQISVGGAILFKDGRGKRQFLLVKVKEDGDWEFPKITVRKGESSVRSVIRMTGEQGEITAKVLEEAGRYTGNTIINGKPISQKFYYYLMVYKGGASDLIGFNKFRWTRVSDVTRKLSTKKEKEMFKNAKEVLKQWESEHSLKEI